MLKSGIESNPRQFVMVVLFMAIVGGLILFTQAKAANILKDFQQARPENVSGIMFYKDFMRDSSGLEAPFTDPEMIQTFTNLLNTMESTTYSVKSLTILESVKIQFTLSGDESKRLELHIMRTEETGDTAIISVSTINGNFSGNGGKVKSADILSWLEELSTREEYSSIWEMGH